MKKKILGSQEALQGGVGRVIIADGRVTIRSHMPFRDRAQS